MKRRISFVQSGCTISVEYLMTLSLFYFLFFLPVKEFSEEVKRNKNALSQIRYVGCCNLTLAVTRKYPLAGTS